jgi:hypothetical protein
MDSEMTGEKNRARRSGVDIASSRYVPDGVIDIFFIDEFLYVLIEFVGKIKEFERVSF